MPSNPAFLNINSSAVAFQDAVLTNNPLMRSFDWNRRQNGLMVENPESRTFMVPARQQVTLFDSSRATTIDGTTAFDVDYLNDGRYRFKWSAGSDPGLAVDQGLNFAATNFLVAVAANQIVTVTAATGTPFAGITLGCTLYINSSQDVAIPTFSVLNAGYWVVVALSVTGDAVSLVRPAGTSFSATDESVIGATAANDMIAFVPVVQVGDKMRVSSNLFSVDARQTYTIEEVTSQWVKVSSPTPLPNQAGILPTAAGMKFYLSKRFTRIEVNQRAKVYFNGASDADQELEPWVSGDSANMAWQERVGPVWSISVYNMAQVPMSVNVFSAE